MALGVKLLQPLEGLIDNLGDKSGEPALFAVKKHALLLDQGLESERLAAREHIPQLIQLIIEFLHILLVVVLREALGPALLGLQYCVLIVPSHTAVDKVSADQDSGSPLSGVAMHQRLPALLHNKVHDLHDVEELVESGVGQVLPVAIEEGDSAVHEELRRVGEASRGDDAVPAVGVLARLL